MTNPKNNFGNFFDMDKPADVDMMGKFKPTISEVVKSLIDITAHNPFFYKDENARLAICAGILYATQELSAMKERGERPADVDMGMGAYMMLLGDMMSMTYDQYAGDKEREFFPHNRKDYEQDLEDGMDEGKF